MSLKPIVNTSNPTSGSAAPDIVLGGSLGATRTETVAANVERWLSGTLTADHTLTLTMAAGSRLRFFGVQDATGGRALTISDGTTSVAVGITRTPAARFEIDVYSDGSNLYINSAASGVAVPTPDTLVTPFPIAAAQGLSSPLSGNLTGVRTRMPLTGSLRDLYVFVGTTDAAGHVHAAVFDTGQATVNVKTRVWDGASVLLGASNNYWQSLGDPNLPVSAGQYLDLALITDSNTPSFARAAFSTNAIAQLPTTSFITSGVLPKLGWTYQPGSYTIPATIADAVAGALASYPLIIGRIS